MASETNEVREANRRKSPTPLRQTDGRQIKLETDKLGDTWRETHDERQVKKHRKRHLESRTPLRNKLGEAPREPGTISRLGDT